jgi:molybdopterin molybdotransferase
MNFVEALTFTKALSVVVEKSRQVPAIARTERVGLLDCDGRVLAEDVLADRDYPPVARSVRDGYAVRAAEAPGRLRVVGEVRAGEAANQKLESGCAIEIMTGAPVPEGANAVVMVEHTTRDGEFVQVPEALLGLAINPRGSEARAGDVVIAKGQRMDYARVAMAATVGHAAVCVYAKPRVAVIATGDEVVPVEATPEAHQVRNSNVWSLAAQVKRAGGEPVVLPVAPDTFEGTKALIEQALTCDLVLLSGGVSAGKYDVVEPVLASLGAQFYFDRVLIQPGQPTVFGIVQGKLFFGLPGNPASTMVTFELFAKTALRILSGEVEVEVPLLSGRLTHALQHKPSLTRFLPARLTQGLVEPVAWKGSSDVAALARANAFLVAERGRESYAEGDWIQVLMR